MIFCILIRSRIRNYFNGCLEEEDGALINATVERMFTKKRKDPITKETIFYDERQGFLDLIKDLISTTFNKAKPRLTGNLLILLV